MNILIGLGIGVAAGVMSGLFGIGGGIVMVPMMVLILGLSQQTAQGTSLLALSLPVLALGAFKYYKAGFSDWVLALTLAGGLVIGAYFGSSVAIGLDPVLMRRIFAGFLVCVAIYLFFKK